MCHGGTSFVLQAWRQEIHVVIHGVTNSGALPVLERMAQFASQRHRVLANNIANLSTPDFQPVDVSVSAFREQLGEAIDTRRAAHGSTGGELELPGSREVQIGKDSIRLDPQPIGENIMFQDGNDRDLDRTMQGLVENFMTFRATAQFLRKEFETLHMAISGRV